jgi:hypothetical protein
MERFWAKVEKSDGCWEWTGARLRRGYGRIRVTRQRQMLAHRMSWELAYGPIPEGLYVCHHCDNPPCVRPDHLFLGTNSDNMVDAHQKGRVDVSRLKPPPQPGEKNGHAKLTADDVRYIRAHPERRDLHRLFGVDKTLIYQIRHRKGWKHVA